MGCEVAWPASKHRLERGVGWVGMSKTIKWAWRVGWGAIINIHVLVRFLVHLILLKLM